MKKFESQYLVSLWFALLCFQGFLFPRAACASDETHQITDEKECSIYLAPSSIKGLKGYGVYTTRDIDNGSSILMAPDSPSIPVLDYSDEMNDAKEQWINVFAEYWWTRGVPAHVEYESEAVADFQTTFGSLPNHHCILDSLNVRYPQIPYDDSLVNRETSPGAGAFSYNMGREWFVSKDLKAGDEIFLNYGYCERERDANDWTAHIPMPDDYELAAKIVWNVFKSSSYRTNTTEDGRITLPRGTNALVAALLPESFSHLRSIVASSTDPITGPSDLIPLLAKHVASTPRTPEWIRSNGMCIEHLVPRKSTIPHAGQGAFAQHSIREGQVVVPAPMLQITNRTALLMSNDDDDEQHQGMHPTKWQLLLNYCFGHSDSSILLCPITNAGLINHCSDRTNECGPDGPNAKIQWASSSATAAGTAASSWNDPSTLGKWLNMSLDEMSSQSGRGLSMEIVALRDISPGDEVFIDYGIEWEHAWEEHTANWKSSSSSSEPSTRLSATEANEQFHNDDIDIDIDIDNDGPEQKLLVTGDLRNVTTTTDDDRHRSNYMFTVCRYWTTRLDKHRVFHQNNPTWTEWNDDDILSTYSDDGSHYYGTYQHHSDNMYWPCSVLMKQSTHNDDEDDGNDDDNDDDSYIVRIHQSDFCRTQPWHDHDLPRILTNYPRISIQYLVKPYAGDVHLQWAFRHHIGIPDDMFPTHWKRNE